MTYNSVILVAVDIRLGVVVRTVVTIEAAAVNGRYRNAEALPLAGVVHVEVQKLRFSRHVQAPFSLKHPLDVPTSDSLISTESARLFLPIIRLNSSHLLCIRGRHRVGERSS